MDKKIVDQQNIYSVILRFNIFDDLRFLSHPETVRLFQRALARAQIAVLHSQGHNPRARLSAALPRSVGVESWSDVLVFQVDGRSILHEGVLSADQPDCDGLLKEIIAQQLPVGCQIEHLELIQAKVSPVPVEAKFVFAPESIDQQLTDKIRDVLAASEIDVVRSAGGRKRARTKNIRPYIKSIEIVDSRVELCYAITPTGSVRVDELQQLLGLDSQSLREPIKRKNVVFE